MKEAALPFFLYTVASIAVQALFALFEMAAVSFNKVRLQYYVTLGTKRAIWLNYLLKKPLRLFGTTLIGVNTALQIGSECSRRFYESIHLDPDWAPLTQILLVVVFAELAPLFAAIRHPEKVSMALVPLMILITKALTPLLWAIDTSSHLIRKALKRSTPIPLFLSREEVKMAFEEKDKDEFNEAVGNIFRLKSLRALELMTPLKEVQAFPSNATLAEIRSALSVHYSPIIPIYHRISSNIVGILLLRDLLRLEEHRRILEHARSPWFVAQDTSILEILDQFRSNNQSVAVILNSSGQTLGLLTLEDILEAIFGEEESEPQVVEEVAHFYIERTLDADMLISEFNIQFQANLSCKEGETLNDLLLAALEHPPVKGETVRIGGFTFTVVEPSLLGAKILSVHSTAAALE